MKRHTIQAVAWNSHEGLPWQEGVLTKTTIEFVDQNGGIAEIARKLSKTRKKAHAAAERAHKARPGRRRYLFWLNSMYGLSEQYLLNKGRKLISDALRRNAGVIDLKACSGGVEPFVSIEHPCRISEILEDLKSATRWDFWIAAAA